MASSSRGVGAGGYGGGAYGVGGNWGNPQQQQQHMSMNNVRRQRVSRPFIDVLEIPDLLEAIDLATRQLRGGIARAMDSTLCDEQGNILEPISVTKKNAEANKRSKKIATPHDIYSVLTEQSNKATAQKMANLKHARQQQQKRHAEKNLPIDVDADDSVNSTVVSPIKVKVPSSKPIPSTSIPNPALPRPPSPPRKAKLTAASNSNINSNINMNMNSAMDLTSVPIPKRKQAPVRSNWNSTAKGGPSILTKRPRTEIAPENEASAKRPSTQRDAPQSHPQRRPAPPSMTSIASIAANSKPVPAPLRRKSIAEIAAAEGRSTSNLTGSSKISALRSKEARSKSVDTANYAHIRKSVQTKEQVSRTSHARNNSMALAMSISKAPKVLPTLAPLTSRSSAISSKVANTASRTAASANPSASNSSIPSVAPFPAADVRRRRGLLPLVPSLQRNNSYRNGGGNSAPGDVLVPPGMKAIGTVKPNGYVMLPDGSVRPRVTFDPKPKVPLKLRQTTAEKLFEAWKDIQKMPAMEALVKALRVEQTMYAQAAGKIDYRAAAITHLSGAKRNKN